MLGIRHMNEKVRGKQMVFYVAIKESQKYSIRIPFIM